MRPINKKAKEIQELRKKGLSYRKIGKIYDLTHPAIIYICRKAEKSVVKVIHS